VSVKECIVTVRSTLGLHLRRCSRVADLASRFKAEAWINHGQLRANASSVLELLTLGASHGARLRLEIEGPEAEELLDALSSELERHLLDESI
jgi:phosphotransferase system HPr (HPr) family protein